VWTPSIYTGRVAGSRQLQSAGSARSKAARKLGTGEKGNPAEELQAAWHLQLVLRQLPPPRSFSSSNRPVAFFLFCFLYQALAIRLSGQIHVSLPHLFGFAASSTLALM